MASKTTYELQLKLGASTSQSWKKTINDAKSTLSDFDSLSNAAIASVAAGVTGVVGSIAYAATEALNTYKDFQQEMATVGSISGATALEFEDMKNAAMDAGRVTTFTATESASALEYMSLAGWSSEEAIAGLVPMLRLAASTGAELQTTSDLITDSMSALGLGVDDLDMYIDKLINTNNNANATAEMLMESLVKTGGASRALGASLDDTITALGVMADNGVKAEEAGTALNAIMVRLAGNDTAIKEMTERGIDIWFDDGSFVGFEEALTRINAGLAELTDEERAAALKNIAGTHHYSQMLYLLDSVAQLEEGQVTAWDELETKVENSSGALDRMYAVTTDTLLNAEKRLESAKEDMQLRFADVIADDSKEFLTWLADNLPVVTDAVVDFAEAHQGEFSKALKNASKLISDVWSKALDAGNWMISHRSAIQYALTTVATGIAAIKVATIGLNIATFLSNPLSAAVTVAGLAAVGIASVAGAIEDVRVAAMNANLESHFGNVALSFKEIETVAKSIVSSSVIDDMVASLSNFDSLDSMYSSIQDAVEELNKYNWKVSIGMKLTEDEQDLYKRAIDEYIENAQEYALQTEYAVAVQMSLTFTGDDTVIADRVNEFYNNQYREVSSLGTKLKYAVNAAFNDGLLEIDEIETITNYQNQMAEIQEKLASSQFEAKLARMELDYSGKELTPESFAALQEEIAAQSEELIKSYQEAYDDRRAALDLSHAENYLSDEKYERAIEVLNEEYQSQMDALDLRVAQFGVNTISSNYASEIDDYKQVVNDALERTNNTDDPTNNWHDFPQEMLEKTTRYIRNHDTDAATQDAISSLLDAIPLETLYKLQEDYESLTPEMKRMVDSLSENVDILSTISNYQDYNNTEQADARIMKDINEAVKGGNYPGTSKWLDDYFLDSYTDKSVSEKLREISIKLEDTNDIYGISSYDETLENILGVYNDSPGYQTEWKTYPEKVFDSIVEELSMTAEDYEGINRILDGLEDPMQEVYALQEKWDELNPATQSLVTSIISNYENLSQISGYGQLGEGFKQDNLTNIIKDIVDKVSDSEDYQNIKAFIDTYYNDANYEYLFGEADGTKLYQYRKSDDPTYETIKSYINDVAEETSEAIDNAQTNIINPAIDTAYDLTKSYIMHTFSKGFTTDAILNVNLDTVINKESSSGVTARKGLLNLESSILDKPISLDGIMSNARGGIYTSPILTTFAEEGPEAALPLDGSDRAKRLWIKAGELLGMADESNYTARGRRLLDGMSGASAASRKQSDGNQIIVTYNPQITIQGNANKEEVSQALSLSLSDLKRMLKEIQRENDRVTFSY